MTELTQNEQAANLLRFFADSVNSVTRERIFFNRLAFDLKIAAARAGYHLHLYEPDVERYGFDIVVEDQDDGMGWFQLKAVLRSASTSSWDTTVRFVRPPYAYGHLFNFDPAECGRGGGVILIEIDDETTNGDVVYYYTDFRVLTLLAERYIFEEPYQLEVKARGRPTTARHDAAASVIASIRNDSPESGLRISRKSFLELSGPDALLALMAMRSSVDYAPYCVQHAFQHGVEINLDGQALIRDNALLERIGILRSHMNDLIKLLGANEKFRSFSFTSPYATHASSI